MGKFRSHLSSAIRILILAAVSAAVILIFRPPASVPTTDVNASDSTVGIRLDAAKSLDAESADVSFPWREVNGFLASRLATATIESNRIVPIKFVRCYLSPHGDSVDYVLQRSIFGLPLFTGVRVVPDLSHPEGGRVTGGFIGRLPLPAAWVLVLNPVIGQSVGLFSRELGVIADAKAVEIHPDSLEVRFRER